MARKRSQPKAAKPGQPHKVYPPEKIRPLDPAKPLASFRAPALKAFDRQMPGQGMLDLGSEGEFRVTYPDDPEKE